MWIVIATVLVPAHFALGARELSGGAPASWRWQRAAVRAGVGQEGLSAIAVDVRGGRVAVGDASGAAVGVEGGPFRRVGRVLEVRDLFFDSGGALWVAGIQGLWRLAGPVRDEAAGRGHDVHESHGSAAASGADVREPGSPDVARARDAHEPAGSAAEAVGGTQPLVDATNARLENRSPGLGELARAVRRIAGAAGIIAVATAGGVFLSRESDEGRSWRHLDAGFPSGPVPVLALRVLDEPGVVELWAFAGGNLWRVELLVGGEDIRARDLRKVVVARSPKESVPVDLAVDLPGGAIVLVYPDLIISALAPPGVPLAGRPGASRAPEWTLRRPSLPPGARLRRLALAGGSFWLSSDRGLLRASGLGGSWWRAGSPAGNVSARQIVELGDQLFAAAGTGLLVGSLAVPSQGTAVRPAALALAAAPEVLESGPGIRAVQVAALRYARLGPEPMKHAFRGLARRGWLPVVGLRVGGANDRRRAWDRDQAFVSGDTRHLFDRDESEAVDLDASLTFAWNLGDLAYDPEYVDLTRESRMVIALRDDVLDEVNQLYYERRGIVLQLRMLAELAAPPAPGSAAAPVLAPAISPGSGVATAPQSATAIGAASAASSAGVAADAVKLALRAAELAAGLDAWTGGWFSEQLRLAHEHAEVSR